MTSSTPPAHFPNDWRERREALESLSRAGPNELETVLVQLLRDRHDDLDSLSAALQILHQYHMPVTGILIHLLKDPDPHTRMFAALGLGVVDDTAAVPALLDLLADEDANVRFNVIEALGKLKATEAVVGLIHILQRGDYFESFAAIQALSEIGDPRPQPELMALLYRPALDEPAMRALGETGGPEIVPAVVAWLERRETAALAAANTLARLHERFPGQGVASRLVELLHPGGRERLLAAVPADQARVIEPQDLARLAVVLGWLLDAQPQDNDLRAALGLLLLSMTARQPAAEALARNAPELLSELINEDSSLDKEEQRVLLSSLAASDRPYALPMLVASLDLHDPRLVAQAAEGLALLANATTLEPVLAHLSHPSAQVRQALLKAIQAIPRPDKTGRLLKLLQSEEPLVRESALRALSASDPQLAAPEILAALADPAVPVRRCAVEALAGLEDPQVPSILAEAITDMEPTIRAAAARALAFLSPELAVPLLNQAIHDTDFWVRLYTCRTLGSQAVPACVPVLRDALDDPLPPIHLAAVEALEAIGGPEARSVLEETRKTRTQNGQVDPE